MAGILSPLIGRTLCDRYRVDAVIRTGGMGAVCRAYDTGLERDVAVKVTTVVPKDVQEVQGLRARFLREARAAARIQHPNVVAIYDFGTDPVLELDFLVMELLEGEDLDQRLRRATGLLPITEVLEILRRAATGLAAGHRIGLTHRDVKPGNIFLLAETTGSKVKLLDFGIVQIDRSDGKTLTQLTAFGVNPGTPRYASPEQIQGRNRVSPASDVFSLALTGLEMVGGVPPDGVNSSTEPRAQRRAVERILDLRPELPPCLGATLRRALSLDPADRFADADALLVALTECEKSIYAGASGTGETQELPAAIKRKPAAWIILAGLIAVALLAGSLLKLLQPVTARGDGQALGPDVPPSAYQALAREEAERVVSGFGAQAGDTLWVIVLASFDSTEIEEAREFQRRVEGLGYTANLVTDPVYHEIRDGFIAVIAGPYPHPAVEVELEAVRSRVAADAFVKRVTLSVPASPTSAAP